MRGSIRWEVFGQMQGVDWIYFSKYTLKGFCSQSTCHGCFWFNSLFPKFPFVYLTRNISIWFMNDNLITDAKNASNKFVSHVSKLTIEDLTLKKWQLTVNWSHCRPIRGHLFKISFWLPGVNLGFIQLLVSKIAKLQDQIGQFTQIHWFFFLLFNSRLTRHLLTQVV